MRSINYIAGGTTEANVASLGDNPSGPLKAADNHILAKLMGIRPTGAPFNITMRQLEYIALAHLKFDSELDDLTEFWHILPSRWSRLFKALEQAGMPDDPVGDINKLRAFFDKWVPKLPEAERLIQISEVHIDLLDADEEEETWAAWCTPSKVRKTDLSNDVLVELRMMLPGLWVAGGRAFDVYTYQVTDIVAERVKVSDTSLRRQAAAVVQWLRDTRVVPPAMNYYYRASDAAEEMQRRLHETEEGRFRPLFEAAWKQGYPSLTKLFDEKTQGSTVANNLKSIMSRIGMANTITDDAVKTFCTTTAQKLELLNVPSLEGNGDVNTANAAREAALISAMGARGGTALAGDGTTGAKERDGSVDTLVDSKDFQELLREMDKLSAKTPINLKDAAKELMKSKCAAGIMLLAGTKVDIQQFRNFRGLMIKTNHIPVVSVLQDALRVDKSKKLHTDWDWTIDKALAEKIILGKVAFGTAGDRINWWAELQPLVKLRETAQYVDHVNSKAKITQPTMVFLSSEHQKMLEDPLTNIFGTIGYEGTESGCFNTVWRHFITRTEEFDRIPDSHPKKMSLQILHVQACRLIFENFAQEFQSMHAQPVGLAVKQPKFLAPGAAYDAWQRAGNVLTEIQQELQISNGALSKGQIMRLDSIKDRVNNVPDHLADTADAKVVFAWYGYSTPKRGREPGAEYEKEPNKRTKQFPNDSGVSDAWGDLAYLHGVWVSQDYSQIWFGDNSHATIKEGKQKPAAKDCLADWFGGNSKNKWCTKPKVCTCADHAFVNRDDIEYKRRNEGAELPKRPDDAIEVVKPQAEAVKARGADNHGGAGNAGGKGKGKGGKGKGKGKGGKGKGKGRNF